jgi:glutamine phosphoribosylpyrophosphate amidotransferase
MLKQDGGICSYLWDNFKSWFLEGDSKVEDACAENILRCNKLLKNSTDTPIIAELGGEKVAETSLAEMFSLLKKQANGQKGVLLTNGYANIFYVRDQSGVLRAVGARWHDGGWNVSADAVSYPDAWRAGDQVFSRNPSATL